jgi:hypothetical protein
MGKDRRQQIYVGFVADIDIKIFGVPPLGLGMPFLDRDTCAEGRGYLFLPGFSSLYEVQFCLNERLYNKIAQLNFFSMFFYECQFANFG